MSDKITLEMQGHLQEAVRLMADNGILSSHASQDEMYHNVSTIHLIETGGRLEATSWTGVKGSMQVTQSTFEDTYNKYAGLLEAAGVPRNREDARASAIIGSLYYNDLHDDLNGNDVAAAVAYNSGPAAGANYANGNFSAVRSEGQNYALKFGREMPGVIASLGGLGVMPELGIPFGEIHADVSGVYAFLDKEDPSKLADTSLGLTGRDAFTRQLAALEMAEQMGIPLSEDQKAKIAGEMGRLSPEERADIEALDDDAKKAAFDKRNIISQGNEWYALNNEDGSPRTIPEDGASEALLDQTAQVYDKLEPAKQEMLKAKNAEALAVQEAEHERKIQYAKEAAQAAVDGGQMSEEDALLYMLAAAFAYATGNTELGDQIMSRMFGAASEQGFAENTGVPRGYGHGQQNYEPPLGNAPRDVLAGEDLTAQGFTKKPNQPFWVALNAQGNPVAGNMAFERATPMSTTKMATLLTLADMIKSGEIAPDFLEKNAALVDAMMQDSNNQAPVQLAIAASGSHDAFVARMNEMAKERGLEGTQYGSPVGFNQPNSPLADQATYTTAYDAARVGWMLNHDHAEIAKRYADIGPSHTGVSFDGLNGTSMGKTGTGYGGEGREGANMAWIGIIGSSGASYAVLEAVEGAEQMTYVANAARTAAESASRTAFDVVSARESAKARQPAALETGGNLIGLKLDIDMTQLNPNANGMALVMVATGTRGTGTLGEAMLVNVNTGIVEDSFSFISGGGGPASEREENGPAPGLTQLDFEGHEDINARWGLSESISHDGKPWWADGKGRVQHIKTTDPLDNRSGMWIHPVSSAQSTTWGCPGILPEDSARFFDMYAAQGGFTEATFIDQAVLKRSADLARENERKQAEETLLSIALSSLPESVRAAVEKIGLDANKDLKITSAETKNMSKDSVAVVAGALSGAGVKAQDGTIDSPDEVFLGLQASAAEPVRQSGRV